MVILGFCCRAASSISEFPVEPPETDRAIKCRRGREVNVVARLWAAIVLSVWTPMQ